MSDAGMESLSAITSGRKKYPPAAFAFLQQGLNHTVQKLHGPTPKTWRDVLVWMHENKLSLDDLRDRIEDDSLPEHIQGLLNKIGGMDAMESRHVRGQDLCWGLRELALEHWGLLTLTVLNSWGINTTRDFGEMVFTLVDADVLTKQREDRIEDFDDVYDFATAFGKYEVTTRREGKAS